MAPKRAADDGDGDSDDGLEIVSENIVRRPDEVVVVSHTRKKVRRIPIPAAPPVLATTVSAAPIDDDDSPDEDYVAPPSDDDIDIDNEDNADTNGNLKVNALPSTPFTCGVCLERKEAYDGVSLGAGKDICECVVCRPCSTRSLRAHIASERWPLMCPNCAGELNGWECVKDLQWQDSEAGEALAKLVLEGETPDIKYCSNEKCKMPFEFDVDNDDGTQNSAKIDCPLCKTSTCVRCNRVWHNGSCAKV